MRFSDLGPATCLVVDRRYPGHFDRVREQFGALGVSVRRHLSGPAGSPLAGELDRADTPPPPGWSGPLGSWHQLANFRAIVARAEREGLERFLFLEDDAEPTPEAAAILDAVDPPDGWELLYLGAYHCWADTEEAGPNLLRLRGSLGTHAVAIRSTAYRPILDAFDAGRMPADNLLADRIHPRGRSYAAFPAAAVQGFGPSAITGEPGGWPALFASKGRNWPPPA